MQLSILNPEALNFMLAGNSCQILHMHAHDTSKDRAPEAHVAQLSAVLLLFANSLASSAHFLSFVP